MADDGIEASTKTTSERLPSVYASLQGGKKEQGPTAAVAFQAFLAMWFV